MATTVSDPLVGALLDGRYRVRGRLARGGMATVYTALDTRLDRIVAVKVLRPALAEDEDFVARFIREAKSAARLSHPNVVSVYDQSVYESAPGVAGPAVFLVMEYVAGRTLRDLLRERGRLSPAETLQLAEPVLAALDAAHSAGLVHRDIKPENVLLADDGRVKVADFGLARAIEASSMTATTGLLMGTVAYLAPEQVERSTADARSDVYAAGILLFEMVTGATPYAGDSPLAVAYRHVHEDVPAPSTRTPGVPPALDALVLAATRRDPAERPADAHALLGAVRSARRFLSSDTDHPTQGPPGAVGAGSALLNFRAGTADAGTGETRVLHRPPADPATRLLHAPQPTLVVPRPGAWGTGGDDPAHGSAQLPARRRRRGGRWLALLLALVVVAVGAGGWWYGAGRYTSAPSVLALSRAAAVAKIQAAGLKPAFGAPVHSDTVAAGLVAATAPRPRSRVARGGTVTLALSSGPELHAIPAIAGVEEKTARARLAAQGLRAVTGPGAYSDTVPTGRVIRTDPPPGQRLRSGSRVTLQLSKGRPPLPVPDVRGQDANIAVQNLQAAGFTVTQQRAYDDTVPAGAAVSTSPPGGATAPYGSKLVLMVSKGPQLYDVPDVTGMKAEKARQILTGAGFVVQIRSLPFGSGNVIGQNPDATTRQPRGTTITLSVF